MRKIDSIPMNWNLFRCVTQDCGFRQGKRQNYRKKPNVNKTLPFNLLLQLFNKKKLSEKSSNNNSITESFDVILVHFSAIVFKLWRKLRFQINWLDWLHWHCVHSTNLLQTASESDIILYFIVRLWLHSLHNKRYSIISLIDYRLRKWAERKQFDHIGNTCREKEVHNTQSNQFILDNVLKRNHVHAELLRYLNYNNDLSVVIAGDYCRWVSGDQCDNLESCECDCECNLRVLRINDPNYIII